MPPRRRRQRRLRTSQNNDSIQIAPTTQEDNETGEHANYENEDALQQVMTLLHYVPSNLELCTLNSS
jgi:hypothetical protein